MERLVERILDARRRISATRALLVALTGIDGSGKGWLAARLAERLRADGLSVAVVGADGWLAPPPVRFCAVRPARNFYERGLRLDEMLEQVVLPLRAHRTLRAEARHMEETAADFATRTLVFEDVDVILLEGVFLLKRRYQAFYDLSVWVDCTYETALDRALARRQEELSAEATVHAYRTIYFPAQRVHRELDDPVSAATEVFVNDPRLEPATAVA